MGIKGAPAHFSRCMQETFQGLLHQIMESYLDDILVYGSTFESYLANLEQVFTRLRQTNLTLNPSKCRYGLREVEFLGHLQK